MFYSSQSRLWYKGSFISFVEESKYIWLQHRQPDSSSHSGFFNFFFKERWQNWTQAPTLSHRFPKATMAHMLTPSPVSTGCRNFSRCFQKRRQFWTDPHPKVEKLCFPSWLDNKGGISGSAFEYRKYIFSTLLSRNDFPPVFIEVVVSTLDWRLPPKSW